MELLIVYLFIEFIFLLISNEMFFLTTNLIFLINKKTIKSKFICNLLKKYDWNYFIVPHSVKYLNEFKQINLLHRKCKITGREEVEKLPRQNGKITFKKLL